LNKIRSLFFFIKKNKKSKTTQNQRINSCPPKKTTTYQLTGQGGSQLPKLGQFFKKSEKKIKNQKSNSGSW
jgi:hypothetical protein